MRRCGTPMLSDILARKEGIEPSYYGFGDRAISSYLYFLKYGLCERIRTFDSRLKRALLYQLSYTEIILGIKKLKSKVLVYFKLEMAYIFLLIN